MDFRKTQVVGLVSDDFFWTPTPKNIGFLYRKWEKQLGIYKLEGE